MVRLALCREARNVYSVSCSQATVCTAWNNTNLFVRGRIGLFTILHKTMGGRSLKRATPFRQGSPLSTTPISFAVFQLASSTHPRLPLLHSVSCIVLIVIHSDSTPHSVSLSAFQLHQPDLIRHPPPLLSAPPPPRLVSSPILIVPHGSTLSHQPSPSSHQRPASLINFLVFVILVIQSSAITPHIMGGRQNVRFFQSIPRFLSLISALQGSTSTSTTTSSSVAFERPQRNSS